MAALAAAVLVPATAWSPPSSAAAPKPKPLRVHGEPMRAMTITDVRQFSSTAIPDLQRIRAAGFNTVTVYVYRFMRNAFASELVSGPWTEPDASLAATIDAAHDAGLAVQLVPTAWVGISTIGSFYWRGAVKPADRNAWFDSYRFTVNHYAELAQAHGVELFGVGSEMLSLDGETSQWRRTVAEARQRFRGPVTYFTISTGFTRVAWWSSVDYPGISPYVSLSTNPRPDKAEVVRAWRQVHLPGLRKLSARVGKPLLVSEIGFASSVGAATHPESGAAGAPDESVQRTLYEAFLDTVMTDKAFDGLSFHRWSVRELGPLDAGFSPKGKAAECLFATRWAPAGASAQQCASTGRVLH